MSRTKAPKSPDIIHALGAALAASKLYAQTIDQLITCEDKKDFKGAADLLKLGHEQVLKLKDAHNNLYVPVNAAIKAAAPAKAEKPPRESKEERTSRKHAAAGEPTGKCAKSLAKAVKEADPKITEQSGDEP
jgi:hypothetical protein